MNEQELIAVIEGIAPVLKAYIDERLSGVSSSTPPTKGIETILVGVVDAQKQLELGLTEKLEAIDKRFDETPDEAAIEQGRVDGAKDFAEMLIRQFEAEPALG